MPYKPIPFTAPSTQIGAGLSNLATAMFSGPTAMETANSQSLIDYRSALTDAAKAKERRAGIKSAAGGQLADVVADLFNGPPQAEGDLLTGVPAPSMTPDQHLRSGIPSITRALADMEKIDQLGEVFNMLMANAPGTSDEATFRSIVGAGKTPGVNDAVSIGDREGIRGANASNDMAESLAKIAATPLTDAQVKGGVLQGALPGMTDRETDTLLGILSKPSMTPFDIDGVPGMVDTNDPNAIAQPVPVRTDDGLAAVREMTRTATTGSDDPTGARQTLEAEARSLGLTVQELDAKNTIEDALRNTLTGIRELPPDVQVQYERIMKKVARNTGAVPASALPEGFNLVTP